MKPEELSDLLDAETYHKLLTEFKIFDNRERDIIAFVWGLKK